MPDGLLWTLVVFLLVVFSVRERMKQHKYREKNWEVIGESKASPVSIALTNLIGVAGGIYLSLVLMCTFLELQLPERVYLGRYGLEPLAALSISMALVQPYLQRIVHAWRKI